MAIKTIKHHYSRDQHKAWKEFETAIEAFRNAADSVNRGLTDGPISKEVTEAVWTASLHVVAEGLLPLMKQSEFTIVKLCVPERERMAHEIRKHHETNH